MNDELAKLASDNLEFFGDSVPARDFKFSLNFQNLLENIKKLEPVIRRIEKFAADYDFDENTRGNGYHSFVYVYNSAVRRLLKICKNVKINRGKIFFNKTCYKKDLVAYNELLVNLQIIAEALVDLHEKSEDKSLFSEHGIYDNTIAKTLELIKREAFYGRTFLFHHPDSLKAPIKQMAAFSVAYSEYFYSNEYKILRLLRFPYAYLKYCFSQELFSRRLVKLFDRSTTGFSKSVVVFLESRIFSIFQQITEHKVAVNKAFQIPPDPLYIKYEMSENVVEIPVPNSHIGIRPVSCRLFSSTRRKGMMSVKTSENSSDLSKYLIIHAHGGGWITQTAKLHGSYSKEWALKLDVPIISIDYSLAPEAVFPRAVEEVFFVYCWALQNAERVGSTGENIVLVGDSAGANLITSCVIKCIEMGIPKPKGMLNIYAAFEVNYAAVPSRFLGLMDVILPYKTHMRLFNAYTGVEKTPTPVTKNREIPKPPEDEFAHPIPQHHHLSPYLAPDDVLKNFPKTIILSTIIDSCLDECVEFAKKLKKLDVDVSLDVLEGLNHGFLNFAQVSKPSHAGSKVCMRHLSELLGLE